MSVCVPVPTALGVYTSVQLLLAAAAAGVRVHEVGEKWPLPPATENVTVPVGWATVTDTLLMSRPVSWTVTVQVLVA